MTQDRARAAGEDRGKRTAMRIRSQVPDRIHAPVQTMQSTCGSFARSPLHRDSESLQLPRGHHSVLRPSQLRQALSCRFLLHRETKWQLGMGSPRGNICSPG